MKNVLLIKIKIFADCPYKFTKAESLYCNKDCGANWLDNEYGCQASDADAFCRIKLCQKDVYAKHYTITVFIYFLQILKIAAFQLGRKMIPLRWHIYGMFVLVEG